MSLISASLVFMLMPNRQVFIKLLHAHMTDITLLGQLNKNEQLLLLQHDDFLLVLPVNK
jgi:hypothetical protein